MNATQVDGATALHWAVYRDDVETADLLLKAGANVKAANRQGVTPLFMAALYGNPAIIERLLKAGADAKELGANGETPAHVRGAQRQSGGDQAARRGGRRRQRERIPPLDDRVDVGGGRRTRRRPSRRWSKLGADVSAKSGPAGLPRNYMAQAVNVNAVQAAAKRRREARAAGRTLDEQAAYEQANGLPTPTGTGSGGGNLAVAAPPRGPGRRPRRGGGAAARQDAQDANQDVIIAGLVGGGSGGLTPLVFAAREGDIESAKVLLDAGADVNQTTEYGWTPLLVATNNRNYKLGAVLLERGANPSLANKGGWTPLYLATDNRNIEGGDYPVPKPDMDHLEYITLLLKKGADVNGRVKENTLSRTIFTMQWFFEPGATAFVRASQSSDTALMKLLLAHGADPKIPTDFGDTALTVAGGIGWVEGVTYERSTKENVEAVRMLLDLGLDPNAANRDGRTPLMGAAHKGRNEVIQLLLDRGARLDTRDNGSRDTGNAASLIAGKTWQTLDYAEGLVRVGVQSAIPHPETAALIRKLMAERGLPVPPTNRTSDSICVVELCQ